MAVTDRKLFVGASPKINSRGTGITSGLVDDDSQFSSDFEQQRRILESIRPPQQEFSRFSAASPALLALGSALLSGKSLQGGVGGALDILGQGAGASAPLFADAINRRKAFEAAQRKEGFDLDLAAYNAALDLQKTRAKGKLGEVKAAWIPNPNYDSTKPVSDDNLSHFETTRQAGTDGVTRIRDVIPGSPTFNELVSESNFKGYLVTDPIKLQGRKDGDAWILNPEYKGKNAMNMYLTSQFQTDQYGNTTIKDTRPGSPTEGEYLPKEEYDQISLTKPDDRIEAESNRLELAKVKVNVQELFNEVSKRLGVEPRELSEKEVNLILQQTGVEPGDWNKFSTRYNTTINEAAEILKDFVKKDTPRPEISIEFDGQKEEPESKVNETVYNLETQPDYIDEIFKLDKNDFNYEAKRRAAEDSYRLRDPISAPVQKEITAAFDGFKDLKMIANNIDEGIYKLGELKRILAGLGLDEGAAEFMTGADGLLVSASSAMIKGVPSDFDVNNLKRIIPALGKGDMVNAMQLKRLERVYVDIVKNNLAFNMGMGQRMPPAIELRARELLGNQAVDEVLSTSYTEERIRRIKDVGNDPVKRQKYIDDFGDPLQDSIDILGLPDSAFKNELNEAEFNDMLEMLRNENK